MTTLKFSELSADGVKPEDADLKTRKEGNSQMSYELILVPNL